MKNLAFSTALILLGWTPWALADDGVCRNVATPAQSPLDAVSTQAPTENNDGTTTDPKKERVIIDTGDAQMQRGGDAQFRNGVKINQGERSIGADEVDYDAEDNSYKVKGTVDYRDPKIHVQGTSGSYDAIKGAHVEQAQFELPQVPARGGAEEISVKPNGKIELKKVEYTSCPPEDRDWILKASSISLDTDKRVGTGRGVRVDFKGVPLLYTPLISFPLGDERKSGFLFPDFGHSNRNGVELNVPYYFNLAPNYDLTLTPRYFSRRGLGLDPQFRYLTERQHGTFDAHYLPGDDLTGKDRTFLQWQHLADFDHDWRLTVDAGKVSDDRYFEDFGLGFEGTSATFVERTAELNHYGRHWTLLAQVQKFQTIDQAIPDPVRPYSRLPRFVGRGIWDTRGGFTYTLNSELVYFHRDDLPDVLRGARLDAQPEVSWSFNRSGLYITPSAAYRQTQYNLQNTALGSDRTLERGAPVTSVDAGMIFERTSRRHSSRIQTLEPRLLYLYVPYREQTNLPIFDTGLPDLNLVQLFRRNRYVGADRLSDANQVSFGVTSRMLNASDGRQFLSATIGQTYYFDTPRVTLPGEAPPTRNTSNFISQLALTAYRDWNVSIGNEWNPERSESEKSELAVQYKPADNKVINAGYRFRRDLIEQVDASVAWPIAGNWNIYARGVYSLLENTLIEQFAGFEYSSCCWKLRLVQRSYLNRPDLISDATGQRDSSIAIQIEFKGLGNVGVPIDAFLERSIRGYSRRPR